MNLMKPLIRISLLLLIILLGITALMPGWYDNLGIITDEVSDRYRDNDQIIDREKDRRKQQEREEMAALSNMSVEEYSKLSDESMTRSRRYSLMHELARTNKGQALASLLSTMPAEDWPVTLYNEAIRADSADVVTVLLTEKVPCDYVTPSGRNAFLAAVNSSNSTYFSQLIQAGCNTETANDRSLTDLLIARKKFDLLLEVPKSLQNQTDFDRGFAVVARQNNVAKVDLFLNKGISQHARNKALQQAISSAHSELALLLLDKGADFSNDATTDLAHSLLANAARRELFAVTDAILQRDTGYIKSRNDGHGTLLRDVLRLPGSTQRDALVVKLFHAGLTLSELDHQRTNFLFEAIKQSNSALVALLLNNGANPNQRVYSRSLVAHAQEQNNSESADIVRLLVNAGATSPEEAAKLRAAITPADKVCEAEPAVFDFSDVINKVNAHQSTRKTVTPIQRCEALIMACTQTRQGLDRCMRAVPLCVSGSESACCESSLVSTYTSNRCAGESPTEAVVKIEGLSTKYNIPLLLLNEAYLYPE